MQKRDKKLDLHRETLTRLDKLTSDPELQAVFAGVEISTSMPRYCGVTVP
jgi:hypothetical protein